MFCLPPGEVQLHRRASLLRSRPGVTWYFQCAATRRGMHIPGLYLEHRTDSTMQCSWYTYKVLVKSYLTTILRWLLSADYQEGLPELPGYQVPGTVTQDCESIQLH
jgi:hypothetical protein